VNLEWSGFSIKDREEIFDYIEADNPQAAIEVDNSIEEQVQRLIQFPLSGRIGRIRATRELVITGTAYVVAYSAVGETIRILRALHGARIWPEELSNR